MIELLQDRLARYKLADRVEQDQALKEILQELTLYALWREGFFEQAAFQGGTCLRILYGLPRFSEDLDFVLKAPAPDFRWSAILVGLTNVLAEFGVGAELVDRSRADRGVYVYPTGQRNDGYDLERIARAIRRGEYNYVSLESALSEWGAISQIPVGHLTVMTTGRKGVFRTPWGTIEFTHTKRPLDAILKATVLVPDRPLRLATPEAAWRDLKRVGRNCDMVDSQALEEIIEERCEG